MTDAELKFRGVAIERWGVGRELDVVGWLETNFGKRAKNFGILIKITTLLP